MPSLFSDGLIHVCIPHSACYHICPGILELAQFISFVKPVTIVTVQIALDSMDNGIDESQLLAIERASFYFPGMRNPLPTSLNHIRSYLNTSTSLSLTASRDNTPLPTATRTLRSTDPVIGCYTHASTQGRGYGVPPSACPDGYDLQGDLCYRSCPSGYYGIGPVCWQSCPDGFSDTGTGCQKWASSYGKGCCCLHNPCCGNPFSGCFYDWSCNNGCCDNCKAGYSDTGCTCYSPPDYFIKSTFGRGAGTAMICPYGMVYDAGLCYAPCPTGFNGIGPICWKSNCPNPAYPTPCGTGVCTDSVDDCTQYETNIALSTADAVASSATDAYNYEDPTVGTSDGGENLGAQTINSIQGQC